MIRLTIVMMTVFIALVMFVVVLCGMPEIAYAEAAAQSGTEQAEETKQAEPAAETEQAEKIERTEETAGETVIREQEPPRTEYKTAHLETGDLGNKGAGASHFAYLNGLFLLLTMAFAAAMAEYSYMKKEKTNLKMLGVSLGAMALSVIAAVLTQSFPADSILLTDAFTPLFAALFLLSVGPVFMEWRTESRNRW